MTRIKICGVTTPEAARLAAECGAWAVGFVFYPKSPRFITADRAIEISEALPSTVLKIGVFMDASAAVIKRVDQKVPMDLIQLHGRSASETGKGVGLDRVILATALQTEADVESAKKELAAYVLVDRHRVAGQPSGASVNWALARQLAHAKNQTLLAGALTPETVGDAISQVGPWGVDVSGGVESTPGVKDPKMIRAFCEAVKKADAKTK